MNIFINRCFQGMGAKQEERAKAIERAQSFIKEKGYSQDTDVSRQITEKKNALLLHRSCTLPAAVCDLCSPTTRW